MRRVLHIVQDVADNLAELIPVLDHLRAAAPMADWALRGLGTLQGLNGPGVSFLLEVVDGHGHRNDVVTLGQPFDTGLLAAQLGEREMM